MKSKFDDLFTKIKTHMEWDDQKTFFWFNTPNPNFGGAVPFELFVYRPQKVEKIVDAMIEGY